MMEASQQDVSSPKDGEHEARLTIATVCRDHEVFVRLRAMSVESFDMTLRGTDPTISKGRGHLWIEGSGTVERKGDLVELFNVDDEVLVLFSIDEEKGLSALQSHVVVDVSMACSKPRKISFADAATLPLAFIAATHNICHALDMTIASIGTPVETSTEASSPQRCFFILGVNNPIGSSAMQLLRLMFPSSWIGGTIYSEDKEQLSQDSIRLIMDGGTYVIDGSDPESNPNKVVKEAMGQPPDFAISYPHPQERDPEWLNCLGEPKLYSISDYDVDAINAAAKDGAIARLGMLLGNDQYKVTFPATLVGTGLESISSAVRDPEGNRTSGKRVIRL